MKIVINKCFGSFGVSGKLCKIWNDENYEERKTYDFDSIKMRTDPAFIELVERLGDSACYWGSDLKTVDIPDEATDFMIDEYDGMEKIIAVVNGKLYIIS